MAGKFNPLVDARSSRQASRPGDFRQGFKLGLGEEIALHEVDAAVAECFVLFHGLDAFADDFGADFVAHGDRGADDSFGARTVVKVADEVGVELDVVDGELGEQVETGETGAEVVKREAEAVFLIFGDDLLEVDGVADALVLGDFEDEVVEGEAGFSGGAKGAADAGGRAIDGSGLEVDREACALPVDAEFSGELDGADTAALVEGVEVFRRDLIQDGKG